MKKIISFLVIATTMQVVAHGFDLSFDSFSQWDPIRDKFSMVHFTLPNTAVNDFQWWFFWLPTKQLVPAQSITYNWSTKTCSKQVRGLYYTNAKWSRLWPLDQQSLNGLKLLDPSYNDLVLNGALYTTCGSSWSADLYSIYGQIDFVDNGSDVWSLSAWLMYDVPNNEVDTSKWLYPTLQYFNNQTPIGYVYDNVWGIGFVWWGPLAPAVHAGIINLILTDTGKNINNIFWFLPWGGIGVIWLPGWPYPLSWSISAWLDTIWNISVLGNVLLSRGGLEVSDRQSVLGNPNRSSSVVFSDVINTSDILNTLRKNSDAACRGQQKINSGWPVWSLVTGTPRTVCVFNDNGWDEFDLSYSSDVPFVINLANPSEYDGIEFVVKWRNVVLEGSVPGKEYSINLFVDNGNVLLKNGDFNTEVVNWSTHSTDYGIFDSKGTMISDVADVGPILNATYSATPNVPVWSQTFMETNRDANHYPTVSAHFVYNTLNYLSWNGNSWAVSKVWYWVYLRWNIFINGLLAWWGAGDVPNGLVNKYYIHGRLASLNTALDSSAPRKTLIDDIFGGYGALLQPYINFSDTFSWQCLLNGYAADANGVQTAQPCKVSNDAFKLNPLVLINSWVPSRLLP